MESKESVSLGGCNGSVLLCGEGLLFALAHAEHESFVILIKRQIVGMMLRLADLCIFRAEE